MNVASATRRHRGSPIEPVELLRHVAGILECAGFSLLGDRLDRDDFLRRAQKHLRDIAGVLATCREHFDTAYVSHWAQELGLSELWTAIRRRASGMA
jgi:hypothetical protein